MNLDIIKRALLAILRSWKLIVGVICVIIGLAGFLLPVLPGWVFFFIGLSLLGVGSHPIVLRFRRRAGIPSNEAINRKAYRHYYALRWHLVLAAIILVQILLFTMGPNLSDEFSHILRLGEKLSQNMLFYIIPALVFILGMIGILLSVYFFDTEPNRPRTLWERFFTYQVIALPIVWAFLLIFF